MHINTKSITRILSAISIFSSLAVLGHKPALARLVVLCGHGFPKVRSTAAQSVYQVLTEVDDENDAGGLGINVEKAEGVCELVLEVEWTESLDSLQGTIDEIKAQLNISA